MALDTYANLQAAIASLLNRSDLTAAIQDFIALAEADMNRKVRHWRMETRDDAFTVDGRFEDVPADWLETVRFALATDPPQRLELVSIDMMQEARWSDSSAGKPRFYAHVGGKFEFYPTPEDAYTGELVYLAKIPALTDSATSNWVLTHHPDAYLYGAAVHSAPYLVEDARLPVWAELYRDALVSMNDASNSERWSGSGLRMRVRNGR